MERLLGETPNRTFLFAGLVMECHFCTRINTFHWPEVHVCANDFRRCGTAAIRKYLYSGTV